MSEGGQVSAQVLLQPHWSITNWKKKLEYSKFQSTVAWWSKSRRKGDGAAMGPGARLIIALNADCSQIITITFLSLITLPTQRWRLFTVAPVCSVWTVYLSWEGMGIHFRVLGVTLSQSMQSGLIGLWFSPSYSQIGGWSRERDVIAKWKRGVTLKSLLLSELQIFKAIFFGSDFFLFVFVAPEFPQA